MKQNSARFGTLVTGGVLGLLLGFGISVSVIDRKAPVETATQTGGTAASTASIGQVLTRQRQDQMERDALQRASRTQLWLWLGAQADSARAGEMPRLVRLAGEDDELRKMLAAHWAGLDPEHMLATLMDDLKSPKTAIHKPDDLLRLLFREWGERDSVSLAEAVSDDSKFVGYRELRGKAFDAIMQNDPELGLRKLTEWRVQRYIPPVSKVSEWAAADPEAAAIVIGGITNRNARALSFQELAKAWAKTEPAAALDFARSRLPSGARNELSTAVIKQWVERDAEAAIAYVSARKDRSLLSAVSAPLVTAWAKTDPAAALAWSQEVLPAPARTRAVGIIVGALAKTDLQMGREMVASLSPGGTQLHAAMGLLTTWLNQPAVDVNEVGGWLATFENKSRESQILSAAGLELKHPSAVKHPSFVKDFLSSDYGNLASYGMIVQTAAVEVQRDPIAALEWADTVHESISEKAHELVIEQWHQLQPEAARQWVLAQSKSDRKLRAIARISRALALAGEESLRTWAAQLTAAERRFAQETLKAMPLEDEHAAAVRAAFGE